MKEEVKRILKLVQEGKLSAEDAAELIEAFEGGREEPAAEPQAPPPPPPPPSGEKSEIKDPFRSVIDTIEKLGKEAANSVNWQEVAKQARQSAQRAADTIRGGLDTVKKSGGFGFLGSHESREVILPLNIPDGKLLRIENPCGDVVIAGGKDHGQVSADAKFWGVGEEARAKADAYTLVIEESDSAVVIRQPDVTGAAVDLKIDLKAATAIEIRCESGDIQVRHTGAGCRIQSKSGDIQLEGLDGQIEITTHSGDVTIEDSTASNLVVENKAGDLTLRRVNGSANLRTTSGDVDLRDCDMKSLAIDGVSGDIDVDLRSPITGAVSLRTVSGDAHLAIPDGSDCRVALKSLRGHVACAIPLVDEARTDGQISGKLGEGKGSLDVSAVTGDITVEMHVSF